MGARQELVAVGVPADQVGGRGQPLEILRPERALPVGGRQLGVGLRPRLPPERHPPRSRLSGAAICADDAPCAGSAAQKFRE